MAPSEASAYSDLRGGADIPPHTLNTLPPQQLAPLSKPPVSDL